MVFKNLDLTTALRPELVHGESLLFVQDSVGLYEGKYKIPSYQNGHVYLTSHRICYVDNAEPRKNSIAIDLRDIDRYDFYAGFLKSSPKITLHPKLSKRLSGLVTQVERIGLSPPRSSTSSPGPGINRTHSPVPASTRPSVTWVCPICSFSNVLPPSFDATTANEHTVIPPCQTCGIKPPLATILKAAISAAAGVQRQASSLSQAPTVKQNEGIETNTALSRADGSSFQCPRCTFSNHPSLLSCEICGASLIDSGNSQDFHAPKPPSPGPILERPEQLTATNHEPIKLSFRDGGVQIFYERLKGAMIQRKWLLNNAPPIPAPSIESNSNSPGRGTPEPPTKAVGIAGLERLGMERRKNNESVISSAFEDLEALMASAKDIIALAESLAEKSQTSSAKALLNESVASLGMSATKDMLGSDNLYISELARTLAEYLTDDRVGVLKNEGGIMTLIDLWATYNKKRNGVELVSPADFEKATRQWETLGLPVRLREFKNGLLVVQRHDWTDSKIIAELLGWFQEFRMFEPENSVPWDWRVFGKGVTAQEAATRFGWSIGVAVEELEMAEDKGVLCREESPEGVRFWENFISGGQNNT